MKTCKRNHIYEPIKGSDIGCPECASLNKKLWREKHKDYNKNYYLENKQQIDLANKKWQFEHKEYIKAYNKKRKRTDRSVYFKEYRLKNKEKLSLKNKTWRELNPGKHTAKENKRRASKLNQTPKWLTKEQLLQIQKIYINCPKGYHVDHIIPLQGKFVRGLHVPWNLQYLSAFENLSKSNKIGG